MEVQLTAIVLVSYEVVIGTVATFLSVWNRWDASDLQTDVRWSLTLQMKALGFKPDNPS